MERHIAVTTILKRFAELRVLTAMDEIAWYPRQLQDVGRRPVSLRVVSGDEKAAVTAQ